MKNNVLILMALLLSCGVISCAAAAAGPRTGFQTSSAWLPEIHLPVDMVMVYSSDPEKIATWADAGYETWTMLGASWLSKKTPVVVENPQIVQTNADGAPFEMIPGRAWVIPAAPWIEYMKEHAARAIAGGATGFLPEEPEYFAANGYGEAFKKAWADYYGEPWRRPHDSAENQWLANRLKSHMFTEFYREVFSHVKSIDPAVKCIIPAHSNINYADWRIVAPHHAFAALPHTDGFIAQVWTGTAKHSHMLGGRPVADTFAYAFLEFSYYDSLTRGTPLETWYLADPVEDAPGAPWDDLRAWYEETLVAGLMFPGVNRYECTPWPRRVLMDDKTYGGGPIPQEYASELLSVWTAQRDMPVSDEWPGGKETGVAFLTSDTLMWQRGYGADTFSGFLAPMLAAVRAGLNPRVLPVERFAGEGYPPANVKTIVAGFDAWKPLDKETVEALAGWVEAGGALLLYGSSDDYEDIGKSWWRVAGFTSPEEALMRELELRIKKRKVFESRLQLGIDMPVVSGHKPLEATGAAGDALRSMGNMPAPLPLTAYAVDGAETLLAMKGIPIVWQVECGRGLFVYAGFSGSFVSMKNEGPGVFVELLKRIHETHHGTALHGGGAIVVRRGPYVAARGAAGSHTVEGSYINILRPGEPVVANPVLKEGESVLLLDVDNPRFDRAEPVILNAGCRVDNVRVAAEGNAGEREFSFEASGPAGRFGYVWLRFPGGAAPSADERFEPFTDPARGIFRLRIPLSPEKLAVGINW